MLEKLYIPYGVMAYQHSRADKSHKVRHNFGNFRCILHHLIGDACHFTDNSRDRNLWIDEGVKLITHFAVFILDCKNFSDPIFFWIAPSGFNVEYNKLNIFKGTAFKIYVFDGARCKISATIAGKTSKHFIFRFPATALRLISASGA